MMTTFEGKSRDDGLRPVSTLAKESKERDSPPFTGLTSFNANDQLISLDYGAESKLGGVLSKQGMIEGSNLEKHVKAPIPESILEH
jgi:hypothetical protein